MSTATPSQPGVDADLAARVAASVDAAVEALFREQHDDGHWCAELEGDSILQSEYLLLKWIIKEEDDPRFPAILSYLRKQQRPDGSWGQYPGGAVGGGKLDLSATVKAYLCLKLAGDDVDLPHMQRARELILANGGAEAANTYSKIFLTQLGVMHWDNIPTIPAEMILFPKWFFFHIDKISAWSRTMVLPLAILSHFKPVRRLPDGINIDELYVDKAHLTQGRLRFSRPAFSWKNFFIFGDKVLKLIEKLHLTPLRGIALRKIEKWINEHQRGSEGLGAIFPPMVYTQIAYRCMGYEPDDKRILMEKTELERFMIPETIDGDDTIRLQPCFSAVWDSGIAAYALTECGLTYDDPRMKQGVDWLLSKECRFKGDWARNVPGEVEPAGWYFEYLNEQYPDVDDSVMVSMALQRCGGEKPVAAAKRALTWVLAMQNDDGGWAAFDRTKERPLLEAIPFADHNAIQDPSCPDITGRTLECLGWHGYTADHPAISRAIKFMRSHQEPEGCWFGRWGVNYIYGTWQVIGGVKNVGYDMSEPWVLKASAWLKSVQKEDGSFGETCDSYEDPSLKGVGESTASQTAWATMTLMAIHGPHDPDVIRGIEWLMSTQMDNGDWHEPWFTGTGFPKVFYLKYHLYRLYFPVMCLGRWKRLVESGEG
ncbi:MAG: squalene--hopene cyclase [Phycisphaera sp.]|nr:squalene--hopene cyclase [Phycisphaera sp.]